MPDPTPSRIRLRPIASVPRQPADDTTPAPERPSVPVVERAPLNLFGERRVLATEDILRADSPLDPVAVLESRAHAATQFHLELSQVRTHLQTIRDLTVAVRYVPRLLLANLKLPSGAPAERIQVELAVTTGTRTRRISTFTDGDGVFRLAVPARTVFPSAGLRFEFRGANGRSEIVVAAADVASNGLIGDLRLAVALAPLPQSIVASLIDLLPPGNDDADAPEPPPVTAQFPHLTIGEDGQCQTIYHSDASFDRFRYSVFMRLVEPRTSIVVPTFRVNIPGTTRSVPVPAFESSAFAGNSQPVMYVDRVPVEQPISVDGFRDLLVGFGNGNTVQPGERVPMAGTLGIGYVLRMAQRWTPKGLSLGNLVYSLPLAPGEQQRVAIFERRETSIVRESETLTAEEEQRFEQETDASTEAVFASAFNESAAGGSRFESSSENWGVGGSIILFSAGGGGSSSEGSSSSWMEGHRDTAARSAQEVHTSVERQASARRRLNRTAMRLASTFESAEVTTKTITNHNHTRALTMQYWEVQRLFEVTTAVEGATLVCLVPLQVVRFLPVGQVRALTDETAVANRGTILERYALVLKHADVLERRLPRKYAHGLKLLRQFASDPTATFEPAGGAAQDVIHFSVDGTFLPFERIFVSAVTRRGTKVGRVELGGVLPEIPGALGSPDKAFSTEDALVGELRSRRTGTAHQLSGDLALPASLARNDIVGFEITRQFHQFDYDLVNPIVQTISLLGLSVDVAPSSFINGTVSLSPQALERALGGPLVENFSATIHALTEDGTETEPESFASGYLMGSRHELPPAGLPIPAAQVGPVLRYTQLLEIEQMLQHVVNNTLRYSKAVWQSLSPEERVVMLEGYTIGVPPGGIEDETQNIPLLNCIENRVLGFFGNSMIMPFHIPKGVVDDLEISNADIQDALTDFHKSAFSPPVSVVALPTRGVLGEAVLGSCPSAEKIDLTRFWNWQDSPSDTAPTIADVTLPTEKHVTGALRAPSELTGIAPLINNINANPVAPGAEGALAQALGAAVLAQKGFDIGALTNASTLGQLIQGDQKVADQARTGALETTKQLTAEALAIVGNIVGGIKAGNSEAGTSAAQAVFGTKPAGEKKEEKPKDDKKKEEKPKEEEGGGGGGGGEDQ